MKSLSSLGLALSLVFGCLFLALLAELYYLLWWKKKIANRELDDPGYGGTPAKELLYIFCWKKPSSLSSTAALDPQELRSDSPSAEDWWPETELAGPPRFLFTIKEETKEDLESEDGKSRKGSRSRSLSDGINVSVETPFLTPIASPPYFTPPRSPIAFSGNGFNPLFESSSPPAQLKSLKDAETKLHRRKLGQEVEEEVQKVEGSSIQQDEENDSFITLVIDKNREAEMKHHSSSSQVLPQKQKKETHLRLELRGLN